MKFFAISDTHGTFDYPDIEADAILLLGDIDQTEMIRIDMTYDIPTFYVFGNNDTPLHTRDTSIMSLHGKSVDVGGVRLAGFGGIPRYSGKNNFFEFEEEEVEKTLDGIGGADIFIAHANPMWEAGFDRTDGHRGFNAFTKYIETERPAYFLHGHNHTPYERKLGDAHVVCVYQTYSFEI